MEHILTRSAAAPLHRAGHEPDHLALNPSRWVRRCGLAAAAIATLIALGAAGDRWLRLTTLNAIPGAPAPASHLFTPPVRLTITVSAGLQRAPWVTTDQELLGNVEMWRRLHLADWDNVPAHLRARSLDNMLSRYRDVLSSPSTWDAMRAADWDAVPQPIRTVAYRRMIAYWAGFYDVGAVYELPPWIVAETLNAIVMTESWFDHRARSTNRDGTVDRGLAQASPFARARLRELYVDGRVDANLSDDDYDNPWMATRFVALWMRLMLDETNGDLEMAVRAYNRGIAAAADNVGAAYLGEVQRRRATYIRDVNAPVSWDYVWRHARRLLRNQPTAEPSKGDSDDS